VQLVGERATVGGSDVRERPAATGHVPPPDRQHQVHDRHRLRRRRSVAYRVI